MPSNRCSLGRHKDSSSPRSFSRPRRSHSRPERPMPKRQNQRLANEINHFFVKEMAKAFSLDPTHESELFEQTWDIYSSLVGNLEPASLKQYQADGYTAVTQAPQLLRELVEGIRAGDRSSTG